MRWSVAVLAWAALLAGSLLSVTVRSRVTLIRHRIARVTARVTEMGVQYTGLEASQRRLVRREALLARWTEAMGASE